MNKTQAHEDFHDELQYHEREWLVERIGWALLFAFVLAALFGFFGEGPVSTRTVGDAKAATLTYDRFLRYASPTLLEIAVARGRPGPIAVEVSEAYLRHFEITSIAPSPRIAALVGDRYRFEFDLETVPTTIAIRLKPERIGRKHGSFAVAGTQLDFAQFVYP